MQKFSTLLNTLFFLSLHLTLSAPTISAQDIDGLPSCAKPCLVSAYLATSNACPQTDIKCLCKNGLFLTTSSSCYAASCSAADTATAQAWGIKGCTTVGVTLSQMNATMSGNSSAAHSSPPTTPDVTKQNSNSGKPAEGAKSLGYSTVPSTSLTIAATLSLIVSVLG